MLSEGIDANETTVRYATFDELRRTDRFDHDYSPHWLTDAECAEVARYRDPARREAWLFGRMMGKRLVLDCLLDDALDLSSVEIRSRDERWRPVRPTIRVRGRTLPCSLSISHSDRALLVALSTSPEAPVGVDLAAVETLNPAGLVFWFTERERAEMGVRRPRQAALCWAVKEAVYKAVNQGESFVPRKIEVCRDRAGRLGCIYNGTDLGERFRIETWTVDGHIAAAVSLAPALRTQVQIVSPARHRVPPAARRRGRELVEATATH